MGQIEADNKNGIDEVVMADRSDTDDDDLDDRPASSRSSPLAAPGGSGGVNGGVGVGGGVDGGFESDADAPDTRGDDGVHAKLLNSPTRRNKPRR